MKTTRTLTALLLIGVLAGCAPGLVGGRQTDPNLERVLSTDSDVPAKQGFLYQAMQDAEVAMQSAGFAVAAEEPAEAKAHINNVLYSIDPEFPATPTITSTGLTHFWPGTGFGLREALEGISDEMRSVSSRYSNRGTVVADADQVTMCADEALARADQLVSLGQQALATGSQEELDSLLNEIDRLTKIMIESTAAQEVDACSLEDAKDLLDNLSLQIV